LLVPSATWVLSDTAKRRLQYSDVTNKGTCAAFRTLRIMTFKQLWRAVLAYIRHYLLLLIVRIAVLLMFNAKRSRARADGRFRQRNIDGLVCCKPCCCMRFDLLEVVEVLGGQ
jgi:hypothetical protein